ncbi:MAG: DUF1566 domain-containing protein [Bacteroidetes bacterium]|nr:DUF1566 domain-containing protein [Bacteroidota bacterium]
MRINLSVSKKLFLIILLSLGISGYGQLPYTVVGTGVAKCYNNTTVITCPTDSSAAFFGQDQGLTPSYQDNGNGTVTDLNTGLMWIQARGSKMSWDSAFLMASQCTTGGHNDWHVPTIKELYSLINFNGKSGLTAPQCIAYLDTNYFEIAYGNLAIGERIIDGQDWSANQYKGLTMVGDTTVFGVNFIDGRIKGYPKYKPGTGSTVKYKLYVRFVRGNPDYGKNDFTDNGNQTITDHATGLMWTKDDSQAGMNWEDALAWAQTKNSANYLGYRDWRLPTTKELQSLVDYTRCKDYTNSAAIDPVFNCSAITDEGGNSNWPFYWANTTHLDNMGGVYVAFGEALGWMQSPPWVTYYTLLDVHGAGAQRSDPKAGSYTNYFLGYNQSGQPVYGLGPQGDVIRINNYVRLVRTISNTSGMNDLQNNGSGIRLEQNVPNPFSASTSISFTLARPEAVTLTIYSSTGKKIATVTDGVILSGRNSVCWNGTDLSGTKMPAGIYFYSIQTSKETITKPMILSPE